jgi:hypothetical protein
MRGQGWSTLKFVVFAGSGDHVFLWVEEVAVSTDAVIHPISSITVQYSTTP